MKYGTQTLRLVRPQQHGYVTLAISLVLLFIMTFVAIYAARVGLIEQRVSANDYRARSSFAAGETGLEQGIAFLNANRQYIVSTAANGWRNAGSDLQWTQCQIADTALPCGDGTANVYDTDWWFIANANQPGDATTIKTLQPNNSSYVLHFLTPNEVDDNGFDAPEGFYIRAIATGAPDDNSGEAIVRKDIYFSPPISNPPPAPLIAAGNVNIQGTFDVVTNPNGGGDGVPISVWSGGDADFQGTVGSGATCQLAEYLASGTPSNAEDADFRPCSDCSCPASNSELSTGLLSSKDTDENIDILDTDGDVTNQDTCFPGHTLASGDPCDSPYESLFEFIFDEIEADKEKVAQRATKRLSDCSSLGPTSAGLIWIDGVCDIPNGTIVGSPEAPLILVADSTARSDLNSNTAFYGIFFTFGEIRLTGGAVVYGSLMTDQSVDVGAGNCALRYDSWILTQLTNSPAAGIPVELAGTWVDYL